MLVHTTCTITKSYIVTKSWCLVNIFTKSCCRENKLQTLLLQQLGTSAAVKTFKKKHTLLTNKSCKHLLGI